MSSKLLTFSLMCFALACSTSMLSAADFELRDTDGRYMDIVHDGKTVGRYMYALDLSNRDALAREWLARCVG